MQTLGFVGGTGPLGRGLALRLGQAGYRVLIGSRDAERGGEGAGKVREKDPAIDVAGVTNDEAARADVVFVTVPHAAQRTTLPPLASALDGRIVVCCVNALVFDERGPAPVPVGAGSATEECATLLPGARVVGAFQNASAVKLARVAKPVTGDVLLTGDDEEARTVVASLVEAIPGMRPVHVGPLRLSRPVEEMSAVLIAIDKRYRRYTSLRITGID